MRNTWILIIIGVILICSVLFGEKKEVNLDDLKIQLDRIEKKLDQLIKKNIGTKGIKPPQVEEADEKWGFKEVERKKIYRLLMQEKIARGKDMQTAYEAVINTYKIPREILLLMETEGREGAWPVK